MYLKNPAPGRDPRLSEMIERIWASAGTSTSNYTDAEQLGRLIADDLAVLLSERFAVGAAGTPEAADRQTDGDQQQELKPAPLPAPATEILGREGELAQLGTPPARPDVRLVTLTGLGGIGKTRLALAVARAVSAHYPATAFAAEAG